ncbi:MAG TPA: energy transducer TonB [Gemmatimonadaceae bacterium]
MRRAIAVAACAAAAALAQAALADGPRYWRASELDVRAAPLADVTPVPPAKAGERPGRVVARVLISESGTAERVVIEKSEPAGLFDDSVISAFRKARYRPGSKNGIRVKSQMHVEVTFHSGNSVSDGRARAAR